MSPRYLVPLAFVFLTSAAHASLESARKAYERKDYATALAEYTVYANRGDTEAMSILSIMYLNGEGMPRDAQKAIQYATRAVAKGDKGGYSLLGTIYLSPRSGVTDKEKGLDFLRTGAEKGEENSLVHLADLMLQGQEVPQDFETASKYYEKAAKRYDSVIAATRLGVMYELGMGRPVDDAKALTWYEYPPNWHERPVPAHIADIFVRKAAIKARNPRRPQDLAEAVSLFGEAVKAGNGEAMHRLGKLYETGRGVQQNYLSAAVLYQSAADAGSAGAMYSGGLLFEKGQGVKQSDAEAMEWFRASADQGFPLARRRLGKAYDEGHIVAVDHAAAISWYCMAVFNEAAGIANPALRAKDLEPRPEQPLAEQLAILDQCGPAEEWQKGVREARSILSRHLMPAVQVEAERISKAMKETHNISKVLATKS